jgi:hypothetical protein
VASFPLLAIVVHDQTREIINFDRGVIVKMHYRPITYRWNHVTDLIDVNPHWSAVALLCHYEIRHFGSTL